MQLAAVDRLVGSTNKHGLIGIEDEVFGIAEVHWITEGVHEVVLATGLSGHRGGMSEYADAQKQGADERAGEQ